jgi:FixJ family two-component response regulator
MRTEPGAAGMATVNSRNDGVGPRMSIIPAPVISVIDPDNDARDATRALLQSVNLSVECYANAQEFLATYDAGQPGCLIVELRLPGMSGLALQARLASSATVPPVIVVTAHGNVALAVQALRANAVDFLEKPFAPQRLLDRVYEALERDAQARHLRALCEELHARAARLTVAERAVLTHVVTGHANRQIASILGTSLKSVEGHRSRLMRKMQAHSLPELVRMSIVLEYSVDVLSQAPVPPEPPARRMAASLFIADDLVQRPGGAGRASAEHIELPGGVLPEGQHASTQPAVAGSGHFELHK